MLTQDITDNLKTKLFFEKSEEGRSIIIRRSFLNTPYNPSPRIVTSLQKKNHACQEEESFFFSKIIGQITLKTLEIFS
jgi:hypothetical protein